MRRSRPAHSALSLPFALIIPLACADVSNPHADGDGSVDAALTCDEGQLDDD